MLLSKIVKLLDNLCKPVRLPIAMRSKTQIWTAEEEEKIREFITKNSDQDISMKEVAALLPHRTFTCVKQHVYNKMSLQIVGHKSWTPEEDQVIRSLYMTTNARDVAAALPGRNLNAVKARANLLGIIKKVTYEKDETFFEIPNEENCAVAGFIAADGNLRADDKRLTINISTKDLEFLKSLVSLMRFNGPISFQTVHRKEYFLKARGQIWPAGTSEMCRMVVSCDQWYEDLGRHWNITPCKTATLMPPNLTNNRLKMAFISGLTCGDGWICKTIKDSGHLAFGMGFTGTKDLLEWVQTTFCSLIPNMNARKLMDRNSPNCRDYCIWGSAFYWLSKMFLSLDIPRLDRKWDLSRMFVDKVGRGDISTRMKTEIALRRPTDAVLAEFGIITHIFTQQSSEISPLAV